MLHMLQYIHFQIIHNNYKTINKELNFITQELEVAKDYFKNEPSQYVLYQIRNMKKRQDHLIKNKDMLKKKFKINFVKKFKQVY